MPPTLLPRILLALAGLGLLGICRLLLRGMLDRRRGWRVALRGRGDIIYDEFRDGVWQRINVPGEILAGSPGRLIYITRMPLPSWAAGRRHEIVSRIQSRLRPPEFVYDDGTAL